jgi:type IV secretory pathway TrbD component
VCADPYAGAKPDGSSADTSVMRQDVWIALVVGLAWLTVARAMLVFAQKLPPTCARCGLRYERRHLGEPVCRCGR